MNFNVLKLLTGPKSTCHMSGLDACQTSTSTAPTACQCQHSQTRSVADHGTGVSSQN